MTWDVETRLDITSWGLSDGDGTADRGDLNSDITAAGTVVYFSGSCHPPADEIDVYIQCANVSTWEATNYASDGTFSRTV